MNRTIRTIDKGTTTDHCLSYRQIYPSASLQHLHRGTDGRVISYDQETCILKGEIVNVSVDESVLTDGRVDVSKGKPICFDPFNNAYTVDMLPKGEAA